MAASFIHGGIRSRSEAPVLLLTLLLIAIKQCEYNTAHTRCRLLAKQTPHQKRPRYVNRKKTNCPFPVFFGHQNLRWLRILLRESTAEYVMTQVLARTVKSASLSGAATPVIPAGLHVAWPRARKKLRDSHSRLSNPWQDGVETSPADRKKSRFQSAATPN